MSDITRDDPKWYVEREDGERLAGPFTTDVDASLARYWVERSLAPETFWIRKAEDEQ